MISIKNNFIRSSQPSFSALGMEVSEKSGKIPIIAAFVDELVYKDKENNFEILEYHPPCGVCGPSKDRYLTYIIGATSPDSRYAEVLEQEAVNQARGLGVYVKTEALCVNPLAGKRAKDKLRMQAILQKQKEIASEKDIQKGENAAKKIINAYPENNAYLYKMS